MQAEIIKITIFPHSLVSQRSWVRRSRVINTYIWVNMNGICNSLNEPRAAKFLRLPYRQNRSRLPIPCLTPEGEQKIDSQKVERDEGDERDRALSSCVRNHREQPMILAIDNWTDYKSPISSSRLWHHLVAVEYRYTWEIWSTREAHTGWVTVIWIVFSITWPGAQAPFCSYAHAQLPWSVAKIIYDEIWAFNGRKVHALVAVNVVTMRADWPGGVAPCPTTRSSAQWKAGHPKNSQQNEYKTFIQ